MTSVTETGIERLAAELRAACTRIGAPADFDPGLERPRDPEHGDWASNAALVLAGRLETSPRALAERLRSA
ncbi:MAG: arginine--tRNA ligase, partial [Gemmatimonadota bacterium]|nr:arginine--tRNA ligase [Gemmatimonadota bacterium]